MRRTLAFRLTLWYAGIFAASSVLGFALVYLLVVSTVRHRTDAELREDLAEYAGLYHGGEERVLAELEQEARDPRARDAFFRLADTAGTERATAGFTPEEGRAPAAVLAGLARGGEPVLRTLRLPGHEERFRAIYGLVAPGVVMGIGKSLEEDDDLVRAFRNGFLAALLAVTGLGAPVGWFMARQALRGVGDVTRTAREIAGGALDRRVSVRSRGDEIELLADTFNAMLDRIQSLVRGMREMTDNLAHDIRSPLTRIHAGAEQALAPGAGSAERESLAVTAREESERLMRLIDASLDIAEAESGAARMSLAEIDLGAVADDACDLFRTVAEDKRIRLSVERTAPARVRGDLPMLQRAVANLVDNALKYTPAEGAVTLTAGGDGGIVRLAVADTGQGVPAEELPRIFQRFYRGDRSRSDRGNGLGLSLALAFARAHGGDIQVESAPGRGSVFTLSLPAAPRA